MAHPIPSSSTEVIDLALSIVSVPEAEQWPPANNDSDSAGEYSRVVRDWDGRAAGGTIDRY